MRVMCAVLLQLLVTLSLYPCSIFCYTTGGQTFFCGNEDWNATNPAIMGFRAKNGGNGFVVFGWKNLLPRYVQAGINSKGLCFDWAAVPPQRFVPDTTKVNVTLDFTLEVMRTCATVHDAIEYVKKYNVPHLGEEHIMFADRSGVSCIIEYNHSQLRAVRKEGQSQYMTNFHLTDTSLGWYPCDRYATMDDFFKEKGHKETRLVELLDAVHQEGQYPTAYSYVFNLSTMRITVFRNHDYHVRRAYYLDELIGKDALVELSF